MKTRFIVVLLLVGILINNSLYPTLASVSEDSVSDIDVLCDEIEPKASEIISTYKYFTNASGNDKIYVYADLYTLNKGTITADITLQVYENGVWNYETSWYKEVSDKNSLVFSSYYTGTKGKKYRAIVYYTAEVNDKWDQRTVTTNTSTAY